MSGSATPDRARIDAAVDDVGGDLARLVRDGEGREWLESRSLPIFDLDCESEPERKLGWTLFAVLFGASAPRARATEAADPLAPLRAWVAAEDGRGARVYRTAVGYRVLITSPALDPASAETDALLARLGVDAASRRASRVEGRFGARLTPPDGAATCRFLEALGRAAEGGTARLVERHDVSTRAFDPLPLG